MKSTQKVRPLQWVAIDLLALLVVVGWGMTTYALAIGTWRPLDMVVPDYWPLLAFPVAVAVGCGLAVLLGVQLSAMGVIGSGVGPRPEPRAAEAVTHRQTTVSVPAPHREKRPGAPLPSGTRERKKMRQQRRSYHPQS
jgi:hypothetical protein